MYLKLLYRHLLVKQLISRKIRKNVVFHFMKISFNTFCVVYVVGYIDFRQCACHSMRQKSIQKIQSKLDKYIGLLWYFLNPSPLQLLKVERYHQKSNTHYFWGPKFTKNKGNLCFLNRGRASRKGQKLCA